MSALNLIDPAYIEYAYKHSPILCQEELQQIFASDPPPKGLDEKTMYLLSYIIGEVVLLIAANRTDDLPDDSTSSPITTNNGGIWDDRSY